MADQALQPEEITTKEEEPHAHKVVEAIRDLNQEQQDGHHPQEEQQKNQSGQNHVTVPNMSPTTVYERGMTEHVMKNATLELAVMTVEIANLNPSPRIRICLHERATIRERKLDCNLK